MKKQKGITLVALIITIIIMFIVAGISIKILVIDNNLFQDVTNAKTLYEITRDGGKS